MQDTIEASVRAFHQKFGHPCPRRHTPLSQATKEFRKRLIREEAEELCEAIDSGDAVKLLQEAADLVYVAVGAAIAAGLPFNEAFGCVHKANMEKTPTGSGNKPGKPEGWQPPTAAIAWYVALANGVMES